MIHSQQSYEQYPHHLDNPDDLRLIKSIRSLNKSEKRLIKAKALRIWVENNPKIHLFNYWYYRIKERKIINLIREGLGD